jgi:hypothetical protein
MSATMPRQGGRVQLEQSDMRLALIMAKMAKEGFSRASIEETKYLIKKPRAVVQEEKKRGVEFAGHKQVKAPIQRNPVMLCQTKRPAAFLPKIVPQKIRRHAGEAKEQVHLPVPDAESGLQS